VQLTAPRRSGWRTVRADFEHSLADLAVTAARIASEQRRGADYVRVTVALGPLTRHPRHWPSPVSSSSPP